ncbi:hypothetical protein ACPZ19_44695 [Amycolatopsis lurida]
MPPPGGGDFRALAEHPDCRVAVFEVPERAESLVDLALRFAAELRPDGPFAVIDPLSDADLAEDALDVAPDGTLATAAHAYRYPESDLPVRLALTDDRAAGQRGLRHDDYVSHWRELAVEGLTTHHLPGEDARDDRLAHLVQALLAYRVAPEVASTARGEAITGRARACRQADGTG